MRDKTMADSELILNQDGSIYHLNITEKDVADTVLLVGDQGRVDVVRSFFEKVDCHVQNREFHTCTGWFKGRRISAISTGIGTDNIDIVLNELDAVVNIDFETKRPREEQRSLNIVRVGTSGTLQEDIPVGSSVVSSYAVGFDSLVHFYQMKYSKREKDLMSEVNSVLRKRSVTPYAVKGSANLVDLFSPGMIPGITITAPGFYGPQGRRLRLAPSIPGLLTDLREIKFESLRITNFEMECSALYALGKLLGHNTCTCCAILANRATGDFAGKHDNIIYKLVGDVLDGLVSI
jgi:uridine phosphorylase